VLVICSLVADSSSLELFCETDIFQVKLIGCIAGWDVKIPIFKKRIWIQSGHLMFSGQGYYTGRIRLFNRFIRHFIGKEITS